MARPDPIQYAERLYAAIRAANFSPISFLAFGNAIKDGVAMRNMPRIAAEPFMRVVGEMLDLEEEATAREIVAATIINQGIPSVLAEPADPPTSDPSASPVTGAPVTHEEVAQQSPAREPPARDSPSQSGKRRTHLR